MKSKTRQKMGPDHPDAKGSNTLLQPETEAKKKTRVSLKCVKVLLVRRGCAERHLLLLALVLLNLLGDSLIVLFSLRLCLAPFLLLLGGAALVARFGLQVDLLLRAIATVGLMIVAIRGLPFRSLVAWCAATLALLWAMVDS